MLPVFGPAQAAPVPPPPRLLPRETLFMVTAPDYLRACALVTNAPYGALWHSPAMKPFRDHFMSKMTDDLLKPLEQTFGLHYSDFEGLARGQMTFALFSTGDGVAPVLLIDTKDHAAQLRTNLAAVIKKWSDAGKPVQTRKIREVSFTTLMVSPDVLSWNKIFPRKSSDADSKPKNVQLTFGQSDSLLIVSGSDQIIEKILNRQAGGLAPSLDDIPAFHADYEARFRDAPIYAWANVQSLVNAWSTPDTSEESSGPRWDELFNVTGLSAISSAAVSCTSSPDGVGTTIFVRVPEDKRQGILQMLAADPKDSSPPPFVGTDCAKFWRWRIDIPRSWRQMESMLSNLNPQIMGLLNIVLQNAGKDKDEHYNLKSELLSNLGDDVILYQKAPEGATVEEIKSPPALYLIGSPNAERLAAALKVGLGFISQSGGGIQDREFLGRKIYSASFSPSGQGGTSLNFAASGGYLGISSDAGFLEQYLRSAENMPRPLADTPALRDAAQQVGGMNTGWFGYESQAQTMRPLFELLRNQPQSFSEVVSSPAPVVGNGTPSDPLAKLREWSDFSLLPRFDDVSKYFYWSVYAGGFSSEGFTMKLFAPTPPQLR